APRPGVASSVYLAYTLDSGPEALIPAGAASRSVPGPGELPQVFETMEDLIARAAWNNLQVRLTRPQSAVTLEKDGTTVIYLKGIGTQVKANDPLLIVNFGFPQLYRAMTVEPDTLKDRTRVAVQPWTQTGGMEVIGLEAVQESPLDAGALQGILARFMALESHGISPKKTTERVIHHLDPLKQALEEGAEEAAIRTKIEAVLPTLRKEGVTVKNLGSDKLQAWISGLLEELEAAVAPVPEPEAFQIEAVSAPPKTTSLASVLGSLGKAPSRPPRGSADLNRDVTKLLENPGSDVHGKLLAAARPELRDTLYKAWANAPATLPPDFEVHVLRARAAVFGHNAPLKQVITTNQNGGVDVRTEEWNLQRGEALNLEPFRIELTFATQGNGPAQSLRTVVSLGRIADRAEDTRVLTDGESFVLKLDRLQEEVTVLVEDMQGLGFPVALAFEFKNRMFTVAVFVNDDRQVVAVSNPLTPLDFTAEVSPQGIATVSGAVAGLSDVVWLDSPHPQILPGSWIVLERPASSDEIGDLVITRVEKAGERSRAEYGMAAKVTRIELEAPWLDLRGPGLDDFAILRETAVYAQSEKLPLAEVPIPEPLCGGEIELAGLYDGLQPGRWLIVSGERTDVGQLNPEGKVDVPVPGIPAAELVMLAGVEQGVSMMEGSDTVKIPAPGERTHTTITLAKPLAYCYKRDTLKIHGNVAKATHGESRFEVMGSGDAAKSLQSFTLKQPPLTYVSAPTPSGIESTLKVRVNDILWHEADSLAGLRPTDRSYIVRSDDGGQTTVVFGNGERGARLPTGPENVRANYRTGIGKGGNVKKEQITQLATRPLGVKDVINPLPATGGADRESRDQARRNAPLAMLALDRLVSVQDYEDFTRTFAGIGKARATSLSDGRVELVHVTIAGEDDIPIGTDSELLLNLEAALRRFGDPRQPLRVEVRERAFLVVEAEVRVLPDYLWEKVEPKIRAAMLEAFGFDRRDLGQGAKLGEAYRVIQSVPGVDFVDIDTFASRNPEDLSGELEQPPLVRPARVDADGAIHPAQLLYLSPEVPETLILKERKS
ncbi:MAG TPA: putative baseplate assembly protein, partial [Thermoanaerobaculia bacterium]